nr:GYF domain-containing protein [Polyangium spumosum]
MREAIASRVLPPSVLVWREGMDEWVPAFTVPAFADATPTTEEPGAPQHQVSAPRIGGGPMPEKRGQLSTLLGITGPAAPPRTAQGAPIVVPSGAGMDAAPPGGAPITLRPEYGGAAFENALPRGPSAEPPAPVRPPPPVGTGAPGPKRTTPSAIDALWNDVSDDETTNVGELAPPAAKPAKETTTQTPKPAMVAPRAAEGPAKQPLPPPVAAPVKPAEVTRPKASVGAENTSIGPLPKAKGSELSTVGPSPVRAPSKVLTKPTTGEATRPAVGPAIPRPVTDKAADKPSAILRPSALLRPTPAVAPRAGGPAKATPSTPPAAPVEPATAAPPAEPPAPAAALAPTVPTPLEPLAAAPPAAEAAPITAPSRVDELPPAPPPREPSTTAILPPDLTAGGYTGPSMAGAVKLSHEVSRTIRIEGLLADPTTSPLPDKDAAAPANGASEPKTTPPPPMDASPTLPSEKHALEAPFGAASSGEPYTYKELPGARSALAATTQGLRAAAAAPAPAPSTLPVKMIATSSGLLVAMVISAFFVGRCSVKPTVAGGGARAVLANTVREIRDALPQPPKPCWVAKQPVRWAPVVSHKVPFELLPLASGNVSIGYAKSSDEAVGIEVTPSSGQVNEGFVDRVSGEIDRVAPTGTDKGYFVAAKESSGTLASVVQVPAASPFFVGLAEGNLATADRVDAAPQPLWPVSGADPLDSARVIVAGDKGYAVSFRRDGVVMGGFVGPDRKPSGELVKVVGSGGQVGKPMSGWNGREVAILFADRESDEGPWKIRLGHAPAPTIPASTEVIELPAGGPGGDAFAPGIAGLPDGRWVLIWTEGSAGARAVRVQTLGPDFAPVGDPIALSPPAGNFGQGVAVVAGAYVTAVFLQKGKSSYELWGGVLQCG